MQYIALETLNQKPNGEYEASCDTHAFLALQVSLPIRRQNSGRGARAPGTKPDKADAGREGKEEKG